MRLDNCVADLAPGKFAPCMAPDKTLQMGLYARGSASACHCDGEGQISVDMFALGNFVATFAAGDAHRTGVIQCVMSALRELMNSATLPLVWTDKRSTHKRQ